MQPGAMSSMNGRQDGDAGETTERSTTLDVGVVIERRALKSRWQKESWYPVAIIAGGAELPDWSEMVRGEGWTRYYAGRLPLILHRKDTHAYREALASEPPHAYVVLRENDDDIEHPYRPLLVTASPYEAECYIEHGNDIVEKVPLENALVAWLANFVDRHHVEEPFYKRKRKDYRKDERGGHGG